MTKTELEEKIIEYRKEEYYLEDLEKESGKSYAMIRNISARLFKEGRITKKEIDEGNRKRISRKYQEEELNKNILALARNKIIIAQIARELNVQETLVRKRLDKSIELGIITEEEMSKKEGTDLSDEEREVLEKEIIRTLNRGGYLNEIKFEDYQKLLEIKQELIDRGDITEKDIENGRFQRRKREFQEDPDIKETLEYAKQGLLNREIADKQGISEAGVRKRINTADEFGIIDKEQIKKIRENRKKTIPKKEEGTVILSDDEILNYIILGYTVENIGIKVEDLNVSACRKQMKSLIKANGITKEQIKEYREAKVKRDKATILKSLKLGMHKVHIAKNIGICVEKLNKYIKEIEIEKNITDKDIQNWKDKKDKDIILGYLASGMLRSEISKLTGMTYRKINRLIEDIKNEQKITDEDIEIWRELKDIEDVYLVLEGRSKGFLYKEIVKTGKLTYKRIKFISDKLKSRQIISQKEIEDKKQERKSENKVSNIDTFERAIQKTPIKSTQLINYIRLCVQIRDYERAYNILRNRDKLNLLENTNEDEERYKQIEKELLKSHSIYKDVILLMEKGNTNTNAISEITGVSEEIIQFLKLRVSLQKTTFRNITRREKIVDLMANGTFYNIPELEGAPEIEIRDIENQAKYRSVPAEKRDFAQEVKQDTKIREIVLLTKVGIKKEIISKKLKLNIEEIDDAIKKGLQVGLIEENQLDGIKLFFNDKLLSQEEWEH